MAKHEDEERRHCQRVSLQIVGGHALVHRCAKSFAHMRVGEVHPLAEKKLANQVVGKSPPFEEWKLWEGQKEDGFYYTTQDMEELRDEFLRKRIVPRLAMTDFTTIHEISIGKTLFNAYQTSGSMSKS